jgi:Transglutaminase-like superfamily
MVKSLLTLLVSSLNNLHKRVIMKTNKYPTLYHRDIGGNNLNPISWLWKQFILSVCFMSTFTSSSSALTLEEIPYRSKVYNEKTDIYCHLPDPIENLACLAHDAAMGAKNALGLNDNQTTAIMAIELANLIQRLASAPRNSFYVRKFNKPFVNTGNGHLCLLNYYGICGNHQEIFSKAMQFLGIKTRILSVYFMDKTGKRLNHAASEFYLDGKWRFIDITWAAYWLEDGSNVSSMLGFKEILAKKILPSNVNTSDIWYQRYMVKPLNAFGYLDAKKYYLIQYGDSGTIDLDMEYSQENFKHIPNYLGSNKPNAELKLHINVPKKQTGIYNLKVAGIECQEKHPVLSYGQNTKVPLTIGDNSIRLYGEQTLSIIHKPPSTCYVVIEKIKLQSISPE